MNDVVIRILDTSNGVLGDLDLSNPKDFPLALTKGIVNLDNLKARTGTFSKSFKVPNTKNNAKLLSNIDNINSRKDYRDALNRKPCVIIVNNNQIEGGFIQVSKVFEGFELDSFELVFFGNNIDWVKGASELQLSEITSWTNNAQVYNQAAINGVNILDSDTSDICYPYISRGGNAVSNNTEVRDFLPCFYLRSILTRGANSLGWNISSTFLDGVDVKRLACDLSNNFTVRNDLVEESVTRAELTTGSFNIGEGDVVSIVFNNDSTAPNQDDNDNYDTGTGEYTLPSTGRYNFNANIKIGSWTGIDEVFIDVTVELLKGGVVQDSFTREVNKFNLTESVTGTLSSINSAGSNLRIRVSWDASVNTGTANGIVKTGSFFDVQRSSEIIEGDTFDLNDIIPTSIKLIDVINDFTRMFNIYYWTDVKTKTIYFEPRDTFFKSQATAINWSDKLDLSKNYEVDYVSSYKRNVEFKYKDLNNDEWLKGWQDENKRTYARYNHVLPDRFAEGTNTVELGLFSAIYAQTSSEATPILGTSFDSEIAFTTVKIWSAFVPDEEPPTERVLDYNPKIFLFNNGGQTALSSVDRQINLFGTPTTTIPYGIFEDYNNTTSDINLSFTGDDGLFSTYYSKMFKNIEEGGRLVAYFKLSSVDIENLDFRKLVYIEAPSKVKGYYLIEKVIDFKPIEEGLTKVSLFKFENLGSVPIDPNQQGNNDNNGDNGNNPPTLNPIYVEDGGFLIEVGIVDPVTGNIELVYL